MIQPDVAALEAVRSQTQTGAGLSAAKQSRGSVFVRYLIDVRVPVLVMLRLGCGAVDSGEEGGLGEVHQGSVQAKRLGNDGLDPAPHISSGGKRERRVRGES